MFKSNLKDYATERALNIWASVAHNWAGGAETHPLYDEIFDEPMPTTPTDAPTESSVYTYDATPGKYQQTPRQRPDYRILSALESVERALRVSGAPAWMRAYLLYKYPTCGRFVPKRPQVRGIDADEEPARAFVLSGQMSLVLGGFSTPHFIACAVSAVKAAERAFNALLKREIENWPVRSLGSRAPAVRSDNRRRRGTA